MRDVVHSITKTPVPRSAVEAIVQDAFGGAVGLADVEECDEGWFNTALRLTLTDGRRTVMKVAPPPHVTVMTYEHDLMATEVQAMRLVREHTTAPVPEVLWHDTSCTHVPSPLFLMSACPGRLLSELRDAMDPAQHARVDAHLGDVLRQVNAITHPTFGLPAPHAPRFERWSDAFVALLDDVLADGERAGVELPVPYDRIREVSRAHRAALDEVTVPSLVHWDLWDTNVFVDPDTFDVVGVIDFERALWADPLMEGQFLAKADDPAFTAAYGPPMLATASARARRLLYDLYLFCIMTIEIAYRHFGDPAMETFARGRLARTLARLDLG